MVFLYFLETYIQVLRPERRRRMGEIRFLVVIGFRGSFFAAEVPYYLSCVVFGDGIRYSASERDRNLEGE